MTPWRGEGVGYKPAPAPRAPHSPWHILVTLTLSAAGVSGLVGLALYWLTAFTGYAK